jgi:hypothetical protein
MKEKSGLASFGFLNSASDDGTGGFIFPELLFSYEFNCLKCSHHDAGPLDKKYLLPDIGHTLWNETPFAKVYIGYNDQGLFFHFDVQEPIDAVFFPDYEKGDAIELFIDTRNNKQARTTHRFCHHFCILPEPFESVQAKEITCFRSDDSHPLANPDDIKVRIKQSSKGYTAYIMLPSNVLFGFAPQDTHAIGFCYRILRTGKDPQHFALSSFHYRIEKYPYMWPTLHFMDPKK